ncbi:MAG: choice-of-anchor J domain-containing protein [Syntrophothermus sp.]
MKKVFFLIPVIAALNLMGQSTALVTGIITSSFTGTPVIGAKIQAGTVATYSVAGGIYYLNVPPGSYQLVCSKAGFDDVTLTVLNLQAGSSTTQDFLLPERTNLPDSAMAVIDTSYSPTGIAVTWNLPRGPYELLYDDGTQENFSVWSLQGNMNAVHFSALVFPVQITGGKVNTGNTLNYPPGSNPLVPFQISVYKDDGPGGAPGTKIAGPFDVIPATLGWVSFAFPTPVTANGSFYLVMIQGGNAPNASGIAIDETTSAGRSMSRFVTGNGPWLPAPGNFMIRADIIGTGGPLPPVLEVPVAPSQLLGYTVYRLKQGEEYNPAVWTIVGYPSIEKIIDFSWISLPCGPYRWGIRANYSNNRISPVSFSNVIGKCWTKSVTVDVSLSCPESPVEGSTVKLTNLVYPDTLYTTTLTGSSQAVFPKVWRGTYEIRTSRFGYDPSVQIQSISSDTGFSAYLLQQKAPPHALRVNDSTLLASWSPPRPEKTLFSESWESGTFSANNWTVEGGQNWSVSAAYGQPQPSAMFGYSPAVLNYSQTLTSKQIQGENSAVLKLSYDFCLDNFGNTTVNQMAVEIFDGQNWHTLKNYTNEGGSIAWTSQELDISSYTNSAFRIRFRAYGGDSYDINHWNFDNIRVTASEAVAIAGSCVIGYSLYLNNILCNVTTDTTSYLPPQFVTYGLPQVCCVEANYSSGSSAAVCQTFLSHFLPAPEGLTAQVLSQDVRLTWIRPELPGQPLVAPPGLTGYQIFRNGMLVDSVAGQDVVQYTDSSVFPGNYYYHVRAVYDLTFYNFSGQGFSVKDGPAEAYVDYGRGLPFTETWDPASFSHNEWTAGQNWTIDGSKGYPQPSSGFSGTPGLTGYLSSLESTIFNTLHLSCSKVWFEYDISLTDLTATGNEKLFTEIYYNQVWHILEIFYNNSSLPWDHRKIDISAVKGKAFRIRFRAEGTNSQDITGWNIDNIQLYSVCKAPSGLEGNISGEDVILTWDPPECDEGYGLEEGFEENFFPPQNWTITATNTVKTWFHSDNTLPTGVHSGNYAATVSWDYSHQDEYLIAHDILVTGKLTFWSHAFQGSAHLDHYYVEISDNHTLTWNKVFDLSALPPYPSPSGYNEWNSPYEISLDAYMGQVVDIAWHAVDGDGQGLWYSWSVDDCSVGSKKIAPDNQWSGYDVYRKNPGSPTFDKINPSPVAAETYTDENPGNGTFGYYIVQSSEECSAKMTSDTVFADVVTKIEDPSSYNIIKVYPNPVSDHVTIESSGSDIIMISLMNQNAVVLMEKEYRDCKKTSLNTLNFSCGIYFLKVTTTSSVKIEKIILLK